MAMTSPIGDTFSGAFSGAGSSIKGIMGKFMWGIGILLIVGVIVYLAYKAYKNKATYIYPVSLTTIMDNGMEKTRHDLKGGMFSDKGIQNFKVKLPRKQKKHTLGFIPDLAKSNSVDGRLNFITSGDRTTWQQYEKKWVTKELVQDGEHTYEMDLISTPVPRETKQATVNSLKNWRETVDKNKLTAFGIAIGAFIIMVIAHLISLFIQTKIRCPT